MRRINNFLLGETVIANHILVPFMLVAILGLIAEWLERKPTTVIIQRVDSQADYPITLAVPAGDRVKFTFDMVRGERWNICPYVFDDNTVIKWDFHGATEQFEGDKRCAIHTIGQQLDLLVVSHGDKYSQVVIERP